MRVGLVQLCSSDDPKDNLLTVSTFVAEAAGQGARFVLTPEVTNCVSASRKRQADVLQVEAEDMTLAMLQSEAARHGVWLLIGSLVAKWQGSHEPALMCFTPTALYCSSQISLSPY